jgi:hypothetical protein
MVKSGMCRAFAGLAIVVGRRADGNARFLCYTNLGEDPPLMRRPSDDKPETLPLRLALMTVMSMTVEREENVPSCPNHPEYFIDRCPVCRRAAKQV